MSKQTESSKRDFVSQMITLLEEEKASLTAAGFDPSSRIETLKIENNEAEVSEIAQQTAMANAKEATQLSVEKLSIAYKDASNVADLVSGLLGKDNELVKQIRKFRK
jgi:hypothetical protein